MANTVTPTNGTHYRQERYVPVVVELMRPYLYIRGTFSRDYEGNPKAGAVKVPVRNADVQVQNYDVVSGANLTTSATSYLDIPINKNQVINELIDNYEAQAVPDNLIAQRLESGAYSIAKTMEADAIATLTTEGNYTASKTQGTDSTAATIYADIVKDIAQLKKLGVPASKIKVAIDNETEVLLLTDSKFSNTASQIGAELARNGVVGKINGVDVITEDLSAKGAQYIVYGVDWCKAIDEFTIAPRVVDIMDGAHVGASKLEGRMVYADAVTNKKAVVVKFLSVIPSV
jgi:hypothetical protein